MKTLKNILSILAVLSLLIYSSCSNGGNDDPEPDVLAEQLTALMNGGSAWELASVTKDGYDVADQFNGFVLTIGEFTYQTQNGLDSAWPSSGEWQFNNNNPNQVLRDNETLVSVSLSGSQLTLSFAVSGLSGGRTDSVDGDYVFVLNSL